MISQTLPGVIRELFITNDTFHSHNHTRNKNKLRSKMSNPDYMYMYKNFSFIGVYIWNDIQDHLPINTSCPTFKSILRTIFNITI